VGKRNIALQRLGGVWFQEVVLVATWLLTVTWSRPIIL